MEFQGDLIYLSLIQMKYFTGYQCQTLECRYIAAWSFW